MSIKRMTLAEYNAIPRDYRGVWDTERWDWSSWGKVRHQYMGKRTWMTHENGGCVLLIEGKHFEIVEHSREELQQAYYVTCWDECWHYFQRDKSGVIAFGEWVNDNGAALFAFETEQAAQVAVDFFRDRGGIGAQVNQGAQDADRVELLTEEQISALLRAYFDN